MESLSRESYYAHLAVVSCGSHIFNDTVRANFRLANAAVTDEAIWAALETVNLASFVRENGGQQGHGLGDPKLNGAEADGLEQKRQRQIQRGDHGGQTEGTDGTVHFFHWNSLPKRKH